MEPPPFDAVAVAVLVSPPLEPLGHIDEVGESGLRKQAAGIRRSAADAAHHIDGRRRCRHGLDLVDEIRIGTPGLVGDGDQDRLLADVRKVGNAGEMPLSRGAAIDKDRAVVFAQLG